jgi:hypothetical protein
VGAVLAVKKILESIWIRGHLAPSLLRFPHPLAKYFGTDLYRTRNNENELQYKYCKKEIGASSRTLGLLK